MLEDLDNRKWFAGPFYISSHNRTSTDVTTMMRREIGSERLINVDETNTIILSQSTNAHSLIPMRSSPTLQMRIANSDQIFTYV
jgi:hypothetical protein